MTSESEFSPVPVRAWAVITVISGATLLWLWFGLVLSPRVCAAVTVAVPTCPSRQELVQSAMLWTPVLVVIAALGVYAVRRVTENRVLPWLIVCASAALCFAVIVAVRHAWPFA